MYLRTIPASDSDSTVVPRALRTNLVVRLIMPWRLPACWTLILPVAVKLKRFLAPDFVFILGIPLSSKDIRPRPARSLRALRAATACPAGRLRLTEGI